LCFTSKQLPDQKGVLSLSSVKIYLVEISTGLKSSKEKDAYAPQKILKSPHLKVSSISLKHSAHSEISSHRKPAKISVLLFRDTVKFKIRHLYRF